MAVTESGIDTDVSWLLLNAPLPMAVTESGIDTDVIAFRGGRLYVVGRGPAPVSAVVPDHFMSTAVPGLYTFTVTNGTELSVEADDLVPLAVDGSRTVHVAPDPHGGDLVGDEFWLLDQAGSGYMVDCATDSRPSSYVSIDATERAA